jgi:hypothetical protein
VYTSETEQLSIDIAKNGHISAINEGTLLCFASHAGNEGGGRGGIVLDGMLIDDIRRLSLKHCSGN